MGQTENSLDTEKMHVGLTLCTNLDFYKIILDAKVKSKCEIFFWE